jgi:hypothetical protein
MANRIEVISSVKKDISGISKKPPHNEYAFSTQEVYYHSLATPYPVKTELMLETGQKAHPVGFYELSPESVYVNRDGRLAINPTLVASSK